MRLSLATIAGIVVSAIRPSYEGMLGLGLAGYS